MQRKLDEVNSEMMALNQVLPHWEGGYDISPVVKGHLSEMMKRVTGEIDNEGTGFGSSESSFSSLDRLGNADGNVARRGEKVVFGPLTDRVPSQERFNTSSGRPRSEPADSQTVASNSSSSPTKADIRVITLLSTYTAKSCQLFLLLLSANSKPM